VTFILEIPTIYLIKKPHQGTNLINKNKKDGSHCISWYWGRYPSFTRQFLPSVS